MLKTRSSIPIIRTFGQLSMTFGICLLYASPLFSKAERNPSNFAIVPFETHIWSLEDTILKAEEEEFLVSDENENLTIAPSEEIEWSDPFESEVDEDEATPSIQFNVVPHEHLEEKEEEIPFQEDPETDPSLNSDLFESEVDEDEATPPIRFNVVPHEHLEEKEEIPLQEDPETDPSLNDEQILDQYSFKLTATSEHLTTIPVLIPSVGAVFKQNPQKGIAKTWVMREQTSLAHIGIPKKSLFEKVSSETVVRYLNQPLRAVGSTQPQSAPPPSLAPKGSFLNWYSKSSPKNREIAQGEQIIDELRGTPAPSLEPVRTETQVFKPESIVEELELPSSDDEEPIRKETTILKPEEEIFNDIAPREPTEKSFLINFNNVSIVEYINFISSITNKNFIFDNADMDFNVTIISSEPTTIQDIMAALLQELRIHNLSMMEVGNNIIIHRNPQAQSPGKIITEPQKLKPDQVEIATRVFTLIHATPDNVAEVIRPLLSHLAIIEAVPDTGHLIVSDISANLEQINRLIQSIDTPSTPLEVEQYSVRFGDTASIIHLAEQIMSPVTQGKTLVFVPHPARNLIYVISTPSILQKVMSILPTIDSPSRAKGEEDGVPFDSEGFAPTGRAPGTDILDRGEGVWTSTLPLGHTESTSFYLYKLQYRKGDEIQEALQSLGESLQATTGEQTDLITTIESIQYLEASNSLIFTGSVRSIEKLREFIVQIDIPLRQVLIELLIIETTVDNALNIGVEWGTRFGGGNVAGSQAFLSSSPSPLTLALDTAIPGGTLNPAGLTRQTGFNIGVIGRDVVVGGVRFNSWGALVSALNSNTKTNVIMNPKLLVEENTPAEVFAGINTSFQTQAITNDQGDIITSNFEFRDVGSTLRVTPTISANNMITLDIDQEISNVVSVGDTSTGSTGTTTSDTQTTTNISDVSPGPTTRRSTTKTKIHVPNGYFVILSGIISDQKTRVRTQIPCLGGIPGLGGFFSQKRNEDSKRNLLLFIRPIIVEDDEIHHQTKREQDIYKEKTRVKKMWEQEVHETLDLLNLKNTDPTTQY